MWIIVYISFSLVLIVILPFGGLREYVFLSLTPWTMQFLIFYLIITLKQNVNYVIFMGQEKCYVCQMEVRV